MGRDLERYQFVSEKVCLRETFPGAEKLGIFDLILKKINKDSGPPVMRRFLARL